jgi:hypothetical protein
MKNSALIISGVLLLTLSSFSSLSAYALSPVDFSGRWSLDISKSDTLPGITSETLIITQNGNDISIVRTMEFKESQPAKGVINYTIGKRVDSNSKTSTNINTSSWSDDMQSFSITDVVISQRDGKRQELKRVSTYSLSDNGMTLTIISIDTFPEGYPVPVDKRLFRQVFVRQ